MRSFLRGPWSKSRDSWPKQRANHWLKQWLSQRANQQTRNLPLRDLALLGTALLLAGSSGCSGKPRAIPPLYVHASSASTEAMTLYDANGDGTIDPQELQAAPGLAYAAERADQDGDGGLSRDEIEQMIEGWNAKSVGLWTVRCQVMQGRRPVPGAQVRLEPEPFLADYLKTAIGKTNEFGDTYLSVPLEDRPIPDSPPGVQLGLYRVVISKTDDGRETLPAKYNAETTLGQEISFDDPQVASGTVRFQLQR